MSIISTQDGNNFGNIIGPICSTNIGAGDDNGAGDATHCACCAAISTHTLGLNCWILHLASLKQMLLTLERKHSLNYFFRAMKRNIQLI